MSKPLSMHYPQSIKQICRNLSHFILSRDSWDMPSQVAVFKILHCKEYTTIALKPAEKRDKYLRLLILLQVSITLVAKCIDSWQ